MKTTEEREVTPQFGGLKNKNLGVYTINPVVFTPETLDEAIAESIVKRGICHLLNSQAHINFAGPTVYKAVRAKLEAKHGKPAPKGLTEWHETHYEEAKKLAEELVKTLEFDYVAKVTEWAKTDFANRGTASAKRPVLKEYDAVEGFITKQWDTAGDFKRLKCLEACNFTELTIKSSKEEMLAQLAKQYQRPVAVDLSFMEE